MNKCTPAEEITSRWDRYKKHLRQHLPEAEGAFIFSRLNIFYFTGTFANGILWLPIEGDPILFCRRGFERAEIETPLKHIVEFNSYKDIAKSFIQALIPSKGENEFAIFINKLAHDIFNLVGTQDKLISLEPSPKRFGQFDGEIKQFLDVYMKVSKIAKKQFGTAELIFENIFDGKKKQLKIIWAE